MKFNYFTLFYSSRCKKIPDTELLISISGIFLFTQFKSAKMAYFLNNFFQIDFFSHGVSSTCSFTNTSN